MILYFSFQWSTSMFSMIRFNEDYSESLENRRFLLGIRDLLYW